MTQQLTNREYHVTLNLIQGPSPEGWMLNQVQHDVMPSKPELLGYDVRAFESGSGL
jgi:hypothetical protein